MPELLRYSWACGRSMSWVEYQQPGILKIAGVPLDAILEDTRMISFTYLPNEDLFQQFV
jgi:hypothetical protein